MNRFCPPKMLLILGTAGLALFVAGCATPTTPATPDSGPLVPYPPQAPQSSPPANPGGSGGSVQANEMDEVLDAIAAKSGERIRAPQGSDPHSSPIPAGSAPPGDFGTDLGTNPSTNPAARIPAGTIPTGTGANTSRGSSTAGARSNSARPLGRDDDIVSRQLREAAERETDPAVRDQLWKEYNDYRSP